MIHEQYENSWKECALIVILKMSFHTNIFDVLRLIIEMKKRLMNFEHENSKFCKAIPKLFMSSRHANVYV